MSWDVEIWHDTSMWNEGFDQAHEPYVVIRVPNEKEAKIVERWLDTVYNKSLAGKGLYDRWFKARLNPSNPNRTPLTVSSGVYAVSLVSAAISQWEGI